MKFLILLAFALCAFNSFAISNCGDSRDDKSFGHLDWEQAAAYKINSPYIDLEAIVCVGIDRESSKITRFHYRDTTGARRLFNFESLKNKNTVIISRGDFPSAARLVTRSSEPLTLKVTADKVIGGKRYYTLDFKFVRNMGMGFSSTDLRLLRVYGQVDKSGLLVYTKKSNKTIPFKTIQLKVGGDLAIKTLLLLDDYNKTVGNYRADSFPRTTR